MCEYMKENHFVSEYLIISARTSFLESNLEKIIIRLDWLCSVCVLGYSDKKIPQAMIGTLTGNTFLQNF